MESAIKITSHISPMEPNTMTFVAKVNLMDIMNESMAHALVVKVASAIADKFIEEHYAEIVSRLDQNAIANLAVADAGKKIAEEIQRRPNIIEKTRTEVFQRGIFGSLTRL